MSKFRAGDLILVEIPFTDLSGTKKRPAFVLAGEGDDYLVAFITSRIERASREDVVIRKSPSNGLAVESAVLVHKLFTVHAKLIARKLGYCSASERRAVIRAIIAKLEQGL